MQAVCVVGHRAQRDSVRHSLSPCTPPALARRTCGRPPRLTWARSATFYCAAQSYAPWPRVLRGRQALGATQPAPARGLTQHDKARRRRRTEPGGPHVRHAHTCGPPGLLGRAAPPVAALLARIWTPWPPLLHECWAPSRLRPPSLLPPDDLSSTCSVDAAAPPGSAQQSARRLPALPHDICLQLRVPHRPKEPRPLARRPMHSSWREACLNTRLASALLGPRPSPFSSPLTGLNTSNTSGNSTVAHLHTAPVHTCCTAAGVPAWLNRLMPPP